MGPSLLVARARRVRNGAGGRGWPRPVSCAGRRPRISPPAMSVASPRHIRDSPAGGCVHIDAGVDGHWSGHLLHLPPGPDEAIHLYDIRRPARPPADQPHLSTCPPAPALIRLGRPAAERRERRRSPLPLVASISVARRHAAAGKRNVTPFLTAEEAGPDWREETAKYSAQYERIMATLDNPNHDHSGQSRRPDL